MKKPWDVVALCGAIIGVILAAGLVVVFFDDIRRGVDKCRAAVNRRKYIGSVRGKK